MNNFVSSPVLASMINTLKHKVDSTILTNPGNKDEILQLSKEIDSMIEYYYNDKKLFN